MRIDNLILADYVQESQQKLYVIGGAWNTLVVKSFPATHGNLGIGLAIDVGWNETNERHQLSLRLEDADGNATGLSIDAEFEAGRPPGVAAGTDIRAVIALNGPVQIERPGTYAVVVRIDNREMARSRFTAIKAP